MSALGHSKLRKQPSVYSFLPSLILRTAVIRLVRFQWIGCYCFIISRVLFMSRFYLWEWRAEWSSFVPGIFVVSVVVVGGGAGQYLLFLYYYYIYDTFHLWYCFVTILLLKHWWLVGCSVLYWFIVRVYIFSVLFLFHFIWFFSYVNFFLLICHCYFLLLYFIICCLFCLYASTLPFMSHFLFILFIYLFCTFNFFTYISLLLFIIVLYYLWPVLSLCIYTSLWVSSFALL